ncbi:MAG: hypothetical protein M3Y72_12880 [Acidobacteriota bacterium]|nr:hypothetical protein [Acidobacteriota bacterium]
MPEKGEALFQSLFRQAEQIKTRELEAGGYFGDGPTSKQIDELILAVEPISGAISATAAVLFAAFNIAVSIENTWLFPERDPLAEPMTKTLLLLQTFTGTALESIMPEMKPDLEKLASLAIVETAARRQQALHGNKIIWRLVLARVLYRVGKFLGG